MKVINGYPHGVNQVKLTDESTELWQDLNADNIAEMYPNPLYPTPPAVPAPPVAPELEFSNITFDVKVENDELIIHFVQDATYTTEISYTIKRWSM
jgi:hypothetical protein